LVSWSLIVSPFSKFNLPTIAPIADEGAAVEKFPLPSLRELPTDIAEIGRPRINLRLLGHDTVQKWARLNCILDFAEIAE
jgi:hypothetical protein